MSGRHSRTKGASGERELCALLTEQFGVKVARKLGQARDSGNDVDLGGYSIEVKRHKRFAGLYDWMKQADADGRIPVVALRADGKDWLCVMRLNDWCKLAREEV